MSRQADRAGGTALLELMALLLAAESAEDVLRQLAEMAVAVIPDGPSCGITVLRDEPMTAVYAGSIPETVHKDQFQRGTGPTLEAIRTGQAVVVQNLAAEQRWGGFPAAAMAGGAHGVYALPLKLDGKVIGALTLYAHEPDLFPPPVQRIALQFADPATLLLEGALRRLSQDELIVQLHDGMESRALVGQATGIVMAHRRCGPEEALNLLIKISNDRNIKLREIARALVDAAAAGRRLPL